MDSSTVATMSDGPKTSTSPSYGLRQHALSPLETLAQSISTIAPSTTPTLTVPLIFGLAAEGTCLVYIIAVTAVMLVALCIASFARDSASPGSLYTYTRSSLPPAFSALTAWALFFAYVATAASVLGGFLNYAYIFLGSFGLHVPAVPLAFLAAGGAIFVAYHDVKISAQMMLWIEAVSVCLIGFVIALTLWKHGAHFDRTQVRLQGISVQQVRLGVMLAIFSFVGFESATTLGSEAREPLRTIPRAVVRSALLAGLFFVICAYGTVVGFHGAATRLDTDPAPFRFLASQVGFGFVGIIIDAGVLVSMFAATLACVIAASRVLMLMAQEGMTHRWLGTTHPRNETPAVASVLAGILAFLPVATLAHRGVTPADIYGYMGTLAVFGFLTAYAMVAVALAARRKQQHRLTAGTAVLCLLATGAMLAAILGNFFPTPPAPYRYFPFVYAAYLAVAMLWHWQNTRRQRRLA